MIIKREKKKETESDRFKLKYESLFDLCQNKWDPNINLVRLLFSVKYLNHLFSELF